MSLSVVISSKNNADVLECCLKHAISAEPFDKEIIVVDAHSYDGTNEILERYKKFIKVLYDDGTTLSQARNLGLKHANGDIVAFLDTDTIVSKNHFQNYLAVYAAHPEVDAIGSDGIYPLFRSKVQRLDSLLFKACRPNMSYYDTSGLPGWNMSFRRQKLISIGGFTGFLRADDYEINRKISLYNFKLKKVPTSSWHFPRTTLKLLAKEQILWGRNIAQAMVYYALQKLRYSKGERRQKPQRKIEYITMHPILLPILLALIDPFHSIVILLKSRSLNLFAYTAFRTTMFAFGYLQGLHIKKWGEPELG